MAPARAAKPSASLVDFLMVFSCCIVTPDATESAPATIALRALPTKQQLEILANLPRRFLDVRFQHAEFRQIGIPEEQIDEPRRNVVRIERTGQAQPDDLCQGRIERMRAEQF